MTTGEARAYASKIESALVAWTRIYFTSSSPKTTVHVKRGSYVSNNTGQSYFSVSEVENKKRMFPTIDIKFADGCK
jgi:hypothetical protein